MPPGMVPVMESLPRGRDGGEAPACGLAGLGITPARAGRRGTGPCRRCRSRNHSRAGGTEPTSSASAGRHQESLPRGRDGAVTVARWHEPPGITPARAGRRRTRPFTRPSPRNHSRAGGTESQRRHGMGLVRESLPRGRDGGLRWCCTRWATGITPARAGRRMGWWRCRAWGRNHSRAGGTEPTPTPHPCAPTESLPRGRDGALRAVSDRPVHGITPARAGRRPRDVVPA